MNRKTKLVLIHHKKIDTSKLNKKKYLGLLWSKYFME
jgi:hypothetical protein